MNRNAVRMTAISIALATLGFSLEAMANPRIAFEGYTSGQGTPIGGIIVCVADGNPDPWFGSLPYRYADGWNHEPRVPSAWYTGTWSAGGHAGTGVDIEDWASLDDADPGRYVIDFQGFEYDHSYFYDETQGYYPGDAQYGHEDRYYGVMTGGDEGTWTIHDTQTATVVAQGTLGDPLLMDIFYDPLNFGTASFDPDVVGTGTLHVTNDGGAFYNELVTVCQTPVLTLEMRTDDLPLLAENIWAPADEQWAVFSGAVTIGECEEPLQGDDDDTRDDEDVRDDDAADDSPNDDDPVDEEDLPTLCLCTQSAGPNAALRALLFSVSCLWALRRSRRGRTSSKETNTSSTTLS